MPNKDKRKVERAIEYLEKISDAETDDEIEELRENAERLIKDVASSMEIDAALYWTDLLANNTDNLIIYLKKQLEKMNDW